MNNNDLVGLPANRILRIYNQFPRCYVDINQMTSQLPYIAEMGFNVVWINPIQETGKEKHPLRQDPLKMGSNVHAYSGSLYAIKDAEKIDNDFSTNKKQNEKNNQDDIEALKNYTKIAKEHNIIPIFDLILNQVAVDADIYLQHKNWFKYPSEHFGNFCCDFNYSDSNVRPEIMNYLKQEIKKYIKDFGFLGVRVDAAKHLPKNVQLEIYQYIYKLCKRFHGTKPIIYAEIIASPNELQAISKNMQNLGITHVMNTLFLERFTLDYRKVDEFGKGYWETGPNGDKNILHGLWLLRQIILYGENDILGGTISFSGSHDYASLYDSALSDQARSQVEKNWNYRCPIPKFWDEVEKNLIELKKKPIEQQEQYLKEKIAAMAFTSDAGWCLLSGDEFGHSGRKWVFDFYNPCQSGELFTNGWGGKFNLCNFIAGVNSILAKLPVPDRNYWVQHIVIPNKPDLMIVVRHNSGGYEKPADLIIINLSNHKMELNFRDINEIAEIVSLREEPNSLLKERAKRCILDNMETDHDIFCLGDFNNEVFPSNNFKIFDILRNLTPVTAMTAPAFA